MTVLGRWRITRMDLWDRDAIDLVGPAFFQFDAGRSGEFRFIAVEGWMDCRHRQQEGRPFVEFTWDGNDECDPTSGHGWATLQDDGSLRGHIFFYDGDDSGFGAVRAEGD